VSDVTKRVSIGLIGLIAVVTVSVTLGLTVLRPAPELPVAQPLSLASRVPGAVLPVPAGEVLPTIGTDAPVPSAAVLHRALQPLITAKALGGAVSIDVLDPITGEHLLAEQQATARTPASTAKLLTCAAALSTLGPRATLPTTVLTGRTPGQIVLVAGGDVLLSAGAGDPSLVNGRAGLSTLARQVARALRAQAGPGVHPKVGLTLDDSLFTGPAQAPGWDKTDVADGFVAPVYPLEINDGRLTGADYAPRQPDPAMAATQIFAGLLRKQGVLIAGAVHRASAATTGTGVSRQVTMLGQVQSAPISGLVEYALTQSDNTVAEMLGRLVAARAGRPASFAEVGPAVLAQDKKLGVPVAGALLADGSGLSAGSKIPVLALTGVLTQAMSPDHPELRPILSGLPIAAVSGTLQTRFSHPAERAATGVVRAKTGTLIGVSSLAGTMVDADGRLLVFAVMADRVKATDPARAVLDKVAGRLATCGCR
jgi:serine-type D-Ala-D-Ala carboxypeptidase/endopeptidase (penicillin-binding protein 4)